MYPIVVRDITSQWSVKNKKGYEARRLVLFDYILMKMSQLKKPEPKHLNLEEKKIECSKFIP
jgi:hypothetical protein